MCLPRSKRPASTRIALARFVPALTTSPSTSPRRLPPTPKTGAPNSICILAPPASSLAMPRRWLQRLVPRACENMARRVPRCISGPLVQDRVGRNDPARASVSVRTVERAQLTGRHSTRARWRFARLVASRMSMNQHRFDLFARRVRHRSVIAGRSSRQRWRQLRSTASSGLRQTLSSVKRPALAVAPRTSSAPIAVA